MESNYNFLGMVRKLRIKVVVVINKGFLLWVHRLGGGPMDYLVVYVDEILLQGTTMASSRDYMA